MYYCDPEKATECQKRPCYMMHSRKFKWDMMADECCRTTIKDWAMTYEDGTPVVAGEGEDMLKKLCKPCAEELISRGKTVVERPARREKITCAVCGRRRFGLTYVVTGRASRRKQGD